MELNPLFFIAGAYAIAILFVAVLVLINDSVEYLIEKYRQHEVKKTELEPNVIYPRPRNYQTTNLVKKAA